MDTKEKKNCFDKYQAEDIQYCPNDGSQAGISEVNIYYSYYKNVKTLNIPDVSGDFEAAGTIDDDIVMESGHGFGNIEALVDENELTTSLTGNTGNKRHSTSLSMLIPNIRAKTLGYIRKYKNAGLIFIILDRNGKKFVIGNKISPARVSEATGTTGKGEDDNNGYSLTVTTSSPLFEYTKSIPLLPPPNNP